MWRSKQATRSVTTGLIASAAAIEGWNRRTKSLHLVCQEKDPRIAAFKKLQQTSLVKYDSPAQPRGAPKPDSGAVTGVYFSAHWCPPCRKFTPMLSQCYRYLNAFGQPFEVIYVSSDRDEEMFKDYFKEMPWLAVPFSDNELRKQLREDFGIQGIPALVLLTDDGTVITDEGTTAVHCGTEYYPWGPQEMQRGKSDALKAAEEEQMLAVSLERDALLMQQIRGGPQLLRLRGSPGTSISHDVANFAIGSNVFATIGAPQLLKTCGIVYYEVEVLTNEGIVQIGFADAGFETSDEICGAGVGDDCHSWGADGGRKLLWSKGQPLAWNSCWSVGDVIGLAANVELGKVAISVNGVYHGIVFEDEGIKRGVCPAFSCFEFKLRYNLDGRTHGPFRHELPPESIWDGSVPVQL